MVTKDLSEAAFEMNVILERAPEDFINRIPKKFREFLKEIESKTYIFNYDDSKTINQQKLKKETRGLIGLVYRDYICDSDEKKEYIEKINSYLQQQEIERREKYNPDNIFKNKTVNFNENEEAINQNIANMVVYKESFIKKIWNRIIGIFRHN